MILPVGKDSGLTGLAGLIDDQSPKSMRALGAAMRGEGFFLRSIMASAIRKGTPAPGYAFAPRSMISRLTTKNRLSVKSAVPLIKLANAITYDVTGFYSKSQNLQVEVGFTKKRSPLWARMAAWFQQEGFTRPVTRRMRRYFAYMGGRRAESRARRQQRLARWLFLSKNTTELKTPARPIVAPFWAWQRNMALDRIRRNWRVKMEGGRFDPEDVGVERWGRREFQEVLYIPSMIGPVKIDTPIGRGGRNKARRA